jgi:hypothetical protein
MISTESPGAFQLPVAIADEALPSDFDLKRTAETG